MQTNSLTAEEREVLLILMRLGQAYLTEIRAGLPISSIDVLSCLYSLGAKGVVECKARIVIYKPAVAALYWKRVGDDRKFKEAREDQLKKNPELWARVAQGKRSRKRSGTPRVRPETVVIDYLKEYHPDPQTARAITEGRGLGYMTVTRTLNALATKGVVVGEPLQTGQRGRPTMLWHLTEAPTTDDATVADEPGEKKLWFTDDEIGDDDDVYEL